MCGILAILGLGASRHSERADRLLDRLVHRGPDGRGVFSSDDAWLGHRRLAIVDPGPASAQPYVTGEDGARLAWVVNGEIYNHAALREALGGVFPSDGDGAVLGRLFERDGRELAAALDGPFACVVVDEVSGRWVAARDALGICPLYVGHHADGTLWFASEMKALVDDCERVELVPPGHAWVGGDDLPRMVRWDDAAWRDVSHVPDAPPDLDALRDTLVAAVDKRLMSDVPLGVLLSGGLDSSLIASIAARLLEERGGGPIHTFSIGLPGACDLLAARRVAEHIGSIHHEIHFTLDDAIAAIPDVIWHLESFEQVRASVPMYLLARRLRELGIKVVLSGEGADEIFGGYLYFHRAPSARSFHLETVRKVARLHQWDVMRANKAPMAFGVETRVPFLDRDFVALAMDVDPAAKTIDVADRPDGVHPRIEKHLLRAAFDDAERPWLPEEILWRQKEQFSDGVGYAWVDTLREMSEALVTDASWERRRERFGSDAPHTREGYHLRNLFEQMFVEGTAAGRSALETVPRCRSVACCTPEALTWDPAWENSEGDISGRAVAGVHVAADGFALGARPSAAEPVLPR